MREVVQDYKTGNLRLVQVPVPVNKSGGVIVRTAYSLVSTGTERMKLRQARMNLLQKARARPDQVEQVLRSVRQNGLKETYQKVRERLSGLTSLGYSISGVVEEAGPGVDELQVGMRVACAGEGFANHAEFCYVPRNLCARVPDEVSLEDAAFATVGAIAINGVRQAQVSLGDSVLVIGLGLVGLLGVQVLRAAGCRVIGADLDPARAALAKACGASAACACDDSHLADAVAELTDGKGVDAVYIAAGAATAEPMRLAGRVARDRATVAIVGMVKIEADWRTYYKKELRIVMSRSYGPGRYDRAFEERGGEYPIGYVPWTEKRNIEQFLALLAEKKVDTAPLAPKLVDFDGAAAAYQELVDNGRSPTILFRYPAHVPLQRRVDVAATPVRLIHTPRAEVNIGVIGAGNFATSVLIPALKSIPGANLRAICSARGLSAMSAAQRHGFAYCASDYRELLADENIDAVLVATRHDTHARFTADALRAGKHVFVEKPLALTHEELDSVIQAERLSGKIVMPGFNRRFSSLSVAVRDFFAGRSSPMEIVCRVNAGEIEAGSWYHDPDEGGWRLISEGCHFVDLIQFLCGSPPVRARAEMIGGTAPGRQRDTCTATLKMADGSLGTLVYVANGDPQFEKERIEVFGQGRSAVIENFRLARLWDGRRPRTVRAGNSRKGHRDELVAFVRAVAEGGPSPIPFADSVAATVTTFMLVASIGSMATEPMEADAQLCA